jgi:hypothetical protein
MKRSLAPGGVVLIGAAVALALLGVGYGLWSDTLRISGAVATGSVNAAFSLHEVDEGLARGAAGGPVDNGVNEDLEAGGVDTAECYVRPYNSPTPVDDQAVGAADDLIAARPSDFLYVYLKNAYPSFNCYADFDVHNVGSVPLKVNRPVIGPAPGADVLTVEFQSCYEDGTQIEPGREALCTLHVHVERGARPNTEYRFGATICAYQWNIGTAVRCAVPVEVEPIPAELTELQSAPAPATRQ